MNSKRNSAQKQNTYETASSGAGEVSPSGLTPEIAATNSANQVIQLISPWVEKLGYQVVHVELQTYRHKVLRLFIDFLYSATESNAPHGAIGIEDCVKVTRALDEPLEQMTDIDAIFKGSYELEVSSPGADRPLRTEQDFERFSGREVRIHVFRPLSSEELGSPEYQKKNPKQKNFLGKLVGLRRDSGLPKVVLSLDEAETKPGKKKAPKKSLLKAATNGASFTNSAAEVTIPLPLISKANLEPRFDFERE